MEHHIGNGNIQQYVEQAWSLVSDAHIPEAREQSEQLVQIVYTQLQAAPGDTELQQGLLKAYHVAGYTVAMSTRGYDALIAASYFHEMEDLAKKVGDEGQRAIALSYQGDMYRRYGDLTQASQYLEAAYHIPHADKAIQGNSAQLLGRVYSQQGETEQFFRVMAEAEHIARQDDDPPHNSLYGQYCLGTVLIDYARHYSQAGEFPKALEYYTQATQAFPDTPHWQTFLTAMHGLLLVKSGDLESGMPDVLKAAKLANEHGNNRLLDNLYALRDYLGQKAIAFTRADVRLSEALLEG